MPEIKLQICFSGRAYIRFQKIYGVPTVQSELEAALLAVLGEKVTTHMPVSMDPGVSAKRLPVYFSTGSSLSPEQMRQEANLRLPKEIKIISAEYARKGQQRIPDVVAYEFHAVMGVFPEDFDHSLGYNVPEDLDVEQMQMAAEMIIGEYDFSSFSTAPGSCPICTLRNLEVEQQGEHLIITMEGVDFLPHMPQLLVAELLRVGKGEITPLQMQAQMHKREPDPMAEEIPALNLFLKSAESDGAREELIHNNSDGVDYYVFRRQLGENGTVYIVMLQCMDEEFAMRMSHICDFAAREGATRIFAMDDEKARIHSGEQIGRWIPSIVMEPVSPENAGGLDLSGTWYRMRTNTPQ